MGTPADLKTSPVPWLSQGEVVMAGAAPTLALG